jgi:hypothetical protein
MKIVSAILLYFLSLSLLSASNGPIVSFVIGNKYIFRGSLLVIGTGQPNYISASYSEEIISDTTINGHHYFTFRTQDRRWAPSYPNGTDSIFYRRADSCCVYRYNVSMLQEDTIVNLSGSKDSILFSGKYYSSVTRYSTPIFASLLYLYSYWIYGLYEGQMSLKSARINGIMYGDTNLLSVNHQIASPQQWLLYQNYPNPFNPRTQIEFYVSQQVYVSLIVFDMLGRVVFRLNEGYVKSGLHKLEFDGSYFPSGSYFYQMRIGEYIQTKKFILLK